MCAPTPTNAAAADDRVTCRVVIAGAGPAGLLLLALLHQRNKSPSCRVAYDVTIVESRIDLGALEGADLQRHRSWMIGLAGHGLEAIRSVPGLYEGYVADVGVKLTGGSLYLGSKRIAMGATNRNLEEAPENFIVDRNFVVAALARYAREHVAKGSHYTGRYETELLYVDAANRRVLVRDAKTQEEEYLPYDLLVGADGIRSTVREAMVKRHRDFELEVGDIFQAFKAVHIERPESLSPTSIAILPNALPGISNGIYLPETGGMINLSVGTPRNKFDAVPAELKSSDPKVVAAYLKANFKAFELPDEGYADWAEQWVGQPWNRTGQVKCNMYASAECGLVLMGDSAHATSPSIGMGMNTALRDAQKLNELLDELDDDLEKVLPRYSAERVPEGTALSSMAVDLFCFDDRTQATSLIQTIVRGGLHYFLPALVDPDPQTILGTPDKTLSEVYDLAVRQGILKKHSAINHRIRREFFERETGMVKEREGGSLLAKFALIAVPMAAVAVALLVQFK